MRKDKRFVPYVYRWPRSFWWLRRFLFGETWADYMVRMREEIREKKRS
jgi:hypothetical protein